MTAPIDPLGWYSRNRAWLAEVAGSDREHLLAHELALWSRGVSARTAAHFAFAAHNAYEDGTPLEVVRTRREAARYRAARDMGLLPPLPAKLRTLAQHLTGTAETPASPPAWIEAAIGSSVVRGAG